MDAQSNLKRMKRLESYMGFVNINFGGLLVLFKKNMTFDNNNMYFCVTK
jgi:hypothetical protein